MKHLAPLRMLLALLLAAFASGNLSAQVPATGTTNVVHVKGLTAAQRDALQQGSGTHNAPKLVYACVPAGILVFESQGTGAQELRNMTLTTVRQHAAARDITELSISLTEAEARCAQARNR